MYTIKPPLNKENIERIPYIEHKVFSFYIPAYSKNLSFFPSIFRNEKNNSANIYERGNGKGLVYKDLGEVGCHDMFSFVCRYYNCTFEECLFYINRDLQLGFLDTKELPNKVITKEEAIIVNANKSSTTILQVTRRPFEIKDKEFWDEYCLTEEDLIDYKVYPISTYFLTKPDMGRTQYKAASLSYTMDFYFSEDIFRRKIYQPYSTNKKWLSNIDKTIVQGIKNIPKQGSDLIITKSLKDCMVWYKVFGIPAISPNNEGTFIPEEVFDKLKTRYDNIYLNFDNDPPGVLNSGKFSDKYSLPEIFMPNLKYKDISDYLKYDRTRARDFVDSIFNSTQNTK